MSSIELADDDQLLVTQRFRGPPNSGNGGYVGGRLACLLGEGPIEVTLRLPIPLERTLVVSRTDEGMRLIDGKKSLAEATKSSLDLQSVAAPTWDEAVVASTLGC